MSDSIKIIKFNSLEKGTNLLVTGVVHGNEFCGKEAIERVISEIEAGEIKLKAGSVSFIPVCNPRAFKENVRFIDRNLNRFLHEDIDEKFIGQNRYEDKINPILCGAIRQADFLLDIHSYASKGGPFIFLGKDSLEEQNFARDLGVNNFVFGWADAYAKNDVADPKESVSKESMGTTEYAREFGSNGAGAKAITLECGQHLNDDNAEIGYKAILNAMRHLGIIEGENAKKTEQICCKMKSVFYKKKSGKFTEAWQHFDEVKQGETLAIYDDEEEIKTIEDGIIILPKENSEINQEWFYFGVKSDFPC